MEGDAKPVHKGTCGDAMSGIGTLTEFLTSDVCKGIWQAPGGKSAHDEDSLVEKQLNLDQPEIDGCIAVESK